MEKEAFENVLRNYMRNEPFAPFVVELNTGEEIVIEEPGVAFSNGFAGYLSPEPRLINFAHDEVRDIRLPTRELLK